MRQIFNSILKCRIGNQVFICDFLEYDHLSLSVNCEVIKPQNQYLVIYF